VFTVDKVDGVVMEGWTLEVLIHTLSNKTAKPRPYLSVTANNGSTTRSTAPG
jgi:hypothetical protein